MGIRPLVIDGTDYADHQYGRSDAFHCRAMEVMESLGAPMEQLKHMGKKLYGRSFWEISGGTGKRTGFARFYPEFLDLDEDYSLCIRQGLIEQVLIHDVQRHNDGFEVQWGWQFVTMELPAEDDAEGVSKVTIQNVGTGEQRVVRAKYVLACDGARSAVRRWAAPYGVKLQGEALPVTWCVLDAVGLKSDFPDLERLSVIRSQQGIVLIIPREPINGKPAARFDIQLEKSRHEATEEEATRMIKAIFAPFNVEWDEVNWWSSYPGASNIFSVFFLGDACHTHSPRGALNLSFRRMLPTYSPRSISIAGLGLNTAVLEAHNLGWKLGMVLNGIAKPGVLSTYSSERLGVASYLIEMDRKLVQLYAGLEKQTLQDFSSEEAREWLDNLRLFQAANYAYQAGASIVYEPSVLVSTGSNEADAFTIGKPGVPVGSRTRPAKVTRVSDTIPVSIQPRFDGRFTIYILVGNLEKAGALDRLLDLDAYIQESKGSIFARYGREIDVYSKPVAERMPRLLTPQYDNHANGIEAPAPKAAKATVPVGRRLYTYNYDDIPQITGEHASVPHSLFRTSVVTTTAATSKFVLDDIMDRTYPRAGSAGAAAKSRLFHPAHFYCDDIATLSPYRESAPEAGAVFEHQLHAKWAVDTGVGAVIIARPDGHVGMRTVGYGREQWAAVEKYFAEFLI
ncbi:FAD/NAD(P)-binding domain-containing protein [Auriscalpium vulgare]|uniref:FAD/NAD(P)-binding domain-containing protein n=1 Tax=Auriscalpium vulgare TaxID=40419 RepID=A0ACB8RIH9_9AGAM|nr:FAD/NAD(P)-binding domain-containing protein [Auriscalpium vulgare]